MCNLDGLQKAGDSGRQWETVGVYCWVYVERLNISWRR